MEMHFWKSQQLLDKLAYFLMVSCQKLVQALDIKL